MRGSGPPPKLRVVTLADSLGLAGGGERLARLTTLALDPERFERSLCVSRWRPDDRADPAVAEALAGLERGGVRFIGLERSSAAAVWAWRPLVEILRRERVDVLHAHKFGSNVWAAMLGTLAGTPVVVAHEHTWSFEGRPLRRFLDRELIARRASAFIAVSREDRRRMIEVEGIDPEDVTFIPNGIPAAAQPSRKDVRAELGIADDVPLIGSVGTLRAQKRHDLLIEAVARLLPRFSGLQLLIAGDGEQRGPLEHLIRRGELEGSVKLLGRRSDIPDVLAALDVAVSSSDFEGSPLSVMEYMQAGLPVVATRVGGVPDLIDDGQTGRLVPSGNVADLADAIASMLEQPDVAREMGRRGQSVSRERFGLDAMAKRLEGLYEELHAERRVRQWRG